MRIEMICQGFVTDPASDEENTSQTCTEPCQVEQGEPGMFTEMPPGGFKIISHSKHIWINDRNKKRRAKESRDFPVTVASKEGCPELMEGSGQDRFGCSQKNCLFYICRIMGQKKLVRFAELLTFPNVLQNPEGMSGKWSEFFHNSHPITLELACGKGEYAVGLGRLYPERNFLGVDLKGNRLWVGAKKALNEKLVNVGFLRTQIDRISMHFNKGEVSEIWITFPDPQLRTSRAKKRLTHPRFLRLYQQILSPGGIVHLKTDSPSLYRFTKWVIDLYELDVLEDKDDVYAGGENEISEELKIKTHYESLDIAGSNRIHYLSFRLPATILPDKDAALKEMLSEEESDRRS